VRAGEPPLPAKKNIAVLPFRAAPDTPESRASADGLSVELSAMLGRLGVSTALQIAPAEVVRAAHVADAALARREVSANFVLSGTFEQSAGHLRIDAALIDTATARPIRTRVISGSDADPFTFEDRLLDAAVQMLDLPLGPGDRSRLVARDTLVAAAAMAYLQGRGALQSYEKPENVDRAIAAFDRALALDPKYARAYAGRGEAFWRRFEATKATQWTDAALASCARALVLDARLSAAGTCLGRVHDGTGRYEEAVVEYQRALESDPVNSEAYAGLGHAQEKLGRFDDAEATYRAAVRLRPQFWVNYNRLGSFYFSRARYAEAAEMFAQVIALAPDSFRGYSNLGGAYIQLGRYDDAIEAFNKSAAIRPTPTAYSNLGTALFNRGRFAEAARTFEQGVKLAESDARNAQHLRELYGGLADAYYWAPNERPRAAEAYRKAIALAAAELRVNPRDEFVLVDVGAYHAMLGERAEAHELLDRALKLAPSNADIQFRAAVAFHQIGELDPALNALERARAAGYSATVIRDTPNFSDLWQYPRFQKILRGQ
jgi:serine/threonine-protein kinase